MTDDPTPEDPKQLARSVAISGVLGDRDRLDVVVALRRLAEIDKAKRRHPSGRSVAAEGREGRSRPEGSGHLCAALVAWAPTALRGMASDGSQRSARNGDIMRKFVRTLIPVAAGASAGALVVGAVVIAQEDRPVREGPATPVVVVGSDPLSVSGNVSATLDEPVEVEAGGDGLSVDVASLEARLDELKAAVEASAPAPQGEPLARTCRLIGGNDVAGYCGLADPASFIGAVPPEGPPDAPSEVLIQSITINSVDEELEIVLWKDGERVTTVANSFEDNLNGPVLHLTYPVSIEADVITANCNNESEDCQVQLSWVGRLAANS